MHIDLFCTTHNLFKHILFEGSARGNLDPREGQKPFRPNPNGVGDRTTTLRRQLIGAAFRLPFFNFQKARWDDFGSYFDSHCPSAEEYSSFSLSYAATLFTSLALNAAKSSIPFGCIKRHSKAWWSVEVEEAVSKRRKAFAAAHRRNKDCQAYISTSRRASPVIAKAKTEA